METGKVRIGGGDSLLLNIIFPVLIDFVKDYPDIDIDIITEDTDKLLNEPIDEYNHLMDALRYATEGIRVRTFRF